MAWGQLDSDTVWERLMEELGIWMVDLYERLPGSHLLGASPLLEASVFRIKAASAGAPGIPKIRNCSQYRALIPLTPWQPSTSGVRSWWVIAPASCLQGANSGTFSLLPRRLQQSSCCPPTSFNVLFLLPCVALPTPSLPPNLSQIIHLSQSWPQNPT